MSQVVSTSQTRIRFSELMRWVTETQQPFTVERDGEPWVVLLSEGEAFRYGKAATVAASIHCFTTKRTVCTTSGRSFAAGF